MHPILFKIGPWTVYSYGVLVLVAFLTAYVTAQKRAAKAGLPSEMVSDLLLILFVTGILGSRIFYVIQHWDDFRGVFWRAFMIHEGGLVWYGGFLTAACSGLLYAAFRKWPILTLADLAAPSLVLGQGIGRLGCFLNSCCYGKETKSFWAVHFPEDSVARHPVQLYETAACFLIFVILSFFYNRKTRKDGSVILLYIALYASARLGIEFFRGDQSLTLGLSIPQWTSLCLLLGAGVLALANRKRQDR